ncbi:D-methionine transport system ATP-binding protein [Lachnospiraceae bacterium KH1T2]|nr:D-methionine transport system ATP-binding protein [Lachnospiraceae bacterium KH1T2]
MIELRNIVKTFKDDKEKEVEALKNVSITIGDSEIYGIIGFSGAGKSTLVRCINLLEKPTSGEVKIDGVDLLKLSHKELRSERKKIGMIFQHFNLMPSRTVFGNVAFPLKKSGLGKKEIQKKVRELLNLVELSDKENAYPSELSGGQKQRVAIARALANDPKILLSDEATSALDPQTTESILKLLKHLNEKLGITIVLITHEMDVIKRICSRIAVMENGKVVEEGDVFDIFANPKHSLTKDFIKTTSNLYKLDEILKDDINGISPADGEVLTRLTYIQKEVSEPLISTVTKKFDVNLNILLADVEIVSGSPVGGTVVKFSGESIKIDEAIQYLRDRHVGVEVIKDARNPY